MNDDWLRENWGLVAALVLLMPALFVVTRTLIARSAWGQLHRALQALRLARRKHRTLDAQRREGERRVASLQQQSAHVKPRTLQEANEALQDTAALLKIAGDQVMIAENHVRKIIHEEYAPARQAKLRKKYLPHDSDDARPFSF